MATKSLFSSSGRGPTATAKNDAGGKAYSRTAKAALAQMALTGTFGGTYYVGAETELARVLDLANKVSPEFLAKLAIYSRTEGFMKDMPAVLMAMLSTREVPEIFAKAFPLTIDNGKMLKNFVQVIRSGQVGRRSLGNGPKTAVWRYLSGKDDNGIVWDSIGGDVSLADVIKMVHPKPATESRRALYAWLIGKGYNPESLPELVKQYEAFKTNPAGDPPRVPFQMLTSLPLTLEQKKAIARNCSWQEARQSLNMFQKWGVFADTEITQSVANKLRNPELIAKAKVFPYQLLAAYKAVTQNPDGLPREIINALHDAVELATANVPNYGVKIRVATDVSGSMRSYPVTGHRGKATTNVMAIDVAALVSAVVLRNNPDAIVIPFEGAVVDPKRLSLEPRDTIMTNTQKLSSIGGGSTNCSAPLRLLNKQQDKGDLVIFVSDNESWVGQGARYGATAVMHEWEIYKKRNPNAKLVCIDTAPNLTVQAPDRKDILNIGGWSDQCFDVINLFVQDKLNADHLTGLIDAVTLG